MREGTENRREKKFGGFVILECWSRSGRVGDWTAQVVVEPCAFVGSNPGEPTVQLSKSTIGP